MQPLHVPFPEQTDEPVFPSQYLLLSFAFPLPWPLQLNNHGCEKGLLWFIMYSLHVTYMQQPSSWLQRQPLPKRLE